MGAMRRWPRQASVQLVSLAHGGAAELAAEGSRAADLGEERAGGRPINCKDEADKAQSGRRLRRDPSVVLRAKFPAETAILSLVRRP